MARSARGARGARRARRARRAAHLSLSMSIKNFHQERREGSRSYVASLRLSNSLCGWWHRVVAGVVARVNGLLGLVCVCLVCVCLGFACGG